MPYKYPDNVIKIVADDCMAASLEKKTPRKYSVKLFQAAEIIRQLKGQIEELQQLYKETEDGWPIEK